MFNTILKFYNVKEFNNESIQPYTSIPNVFFKKRRKGENHRNYVQITRTKSQRGINRFFPYQFANFPLCAAYKKVFL